MPDSRMTLVGRATGATGGWPVAGGGWPVGQASPPSRPSATHTGSVDRSEVPMSKLSRTLVAATLAAITLAGTTTVAHAQVTDEHARRPPTQGQIGEAWHRRSVSSQQDKAADATLGRVQARERFSIPSGTPAQVPAPASAEPSGQPGWLLASLGLLAVLMLAAGMVVLGARRASRRARPEIPLQPGA